MLEMCTEGILQSLLISKILLMWYWGPAFLTILHLIYASKAKTAKEQWWYLEQQVNTLIGRTFLEIQITFKSLKYCNLVMEQFRNQYFWQCEQTVKKADEKQASLSHKWDSRNTLFDLRGPRITSYTFEETTKKIQVREKALLFKSE